MKQARAVDAELEALFRDCGDDLGRYFARRHGGTEAAADLVQESFLLFTRRLREGAVPRSARAYLFGIARHLSMAFQRAHCREAEPLEQVEEIPDPSPVDARVAAARELIATMPDLQREILDLRFTHGLSYAETAVALGIPVGTVRSRLHNALVLLRAQLEESDLPDL